MKSFKSFIAERCWDGFKSVPGKKPYSPGSCVKEGELEEDWSQKYKSSIDCNNPKGFSQKAHCAGKKKNEDVNEDWSKVNTTFIFLTPTFFHFFFFDTRTKRVCFFTWYRFVTRPTSFCDK